MLLTRLLTGLLLIRANRGESMIHGRSRFNNRPRPRRFTFNIVARRAAAEDTGHMEADLHHVALASWVEEAAELPIAFAQVREDALLDQWLVQRLGDRASIGVTCVYRGQATFIDSGLLKRKRPPGRHWLGWARM